MWRLDIESCCATPQLYLEDVYEATGYRLAADSPAALQADGGRRRGPARAAAVAQRDQGAVQVRPPGPPPRRTSDKVAALGPANGARPLPLRET